jgi:hypothetical protein
MALAALGAWAAGVRTAQGGRRVAAVLLFALTPVLLARALFVPFPDAACALIPYPWYAGIHPWWGFFLAFYFFGLAATYLRRRVLCAACTISACLLSVTFAVQVVGMATLNRDDLHGIALDAICIQTTSYSCGPAAATTLCANLGVPATEREMALLCRTNAITGTDRVNAYWGLRRKLNASPWTVTIARASWDRLRRERRPAMVVLKLGLIWDHWIVVLRSDRRTVWVADPAVGVRRIPRDEFLALWTGEALFVRPAAPPAPVVAGDWHPARRVGASPPTAAAHARRSPGVLES